MLKSGILFALAVGSLGACASGGSAISPLIGDDGGTGDPSDVAATVEDAPGAPADTQKAVDTASAADAGSRTTWRVDVPCYMKYQNTDDTCYEVADIKNNYPKVLSAKKVDGDPAKTYEVSFRFRGLVEGRKFVTPGTKNELTAVTKTVYFEPATKADPIDPTDEHNSLQGLYQMDVSSPQATYYLNVYYKTGHFLYVFDYTHPVKIKGGATVTLRYSDIGNVQVANFAKLIVPGVPPDPNPYNGQFVQADLVSMTEAK